MTRSCEGVKEPQNVSLQLRQVQQCLQVEAHPCNIKCGFDSFTWRNHITAHREPIKPTGHAVMLSDKESWPWTVVNSTWHNGSSSARHRYPLTDGRCKVESFVSMGKGLRRMQTDHLGDRCATPARTGSYRRVEAEECFQMAPFFNTHAGTIVSDHTRVSRTNSVFLTWKASALLGEYKGLTPRNENLGSWVTKFSY